MQGFLYGRDWSRGKVFFVQRCALRKFLVIGQNAHDQIALYAFHSFLKEVLTNADCARAART